MSAATNYDTQFCSSPCQSSKKAHFTESDNSNFSRDSISEVTEEITDYDIDASTSTLLINMTNKIPNTWIPREDFSSLSPKVREI